MIFFHITFQKRLRTIPKWGNQTSPSGRVEMKIAFINDGNFDLYEEPALTFCRILHCITDQNDGLQEIYHGRIALLVRDEDLRTEQTFLSTAQEAIYRAEGYEELVDRWVSLAGFRGYERKASKILYERTLFFDLDFHEPYSHEEAFELAFASFHRLRAAWREGRFPEPTMVTFTTRGLGIYFVLENPIYHTERAERLVECFNRTKNCFFHWLEQILETRLDRQVLDASRVCRIPGFKHPVTGKVVQLLHVKHDEAGNVIRVPSLNDLIGAYKEAHRWEETEVQQPAEQVTRNSQRQDGQPMASQNTVSDSYAYCCCVLESLRLLLEIRNFCMSGCRESFIFLLYNFLSQLVPRDEAQAEVMQVATFFADENGEVAELSRAEVIGAIRAVEKAKWGPLQKQRGAVRHWPEEIRGYYLYSSGQIVSKLDITTEELRKLPLAQFACSNAAAQRRERHEAMIQRRKELILECKKENPELTYAAISKKLNRLREVRESDMKMSRRIVEKVLSEEMQQEREEAEYQKHLIAKHLAEHPEVRGHQVAKLFEVSTTTVSVVKNNLEKWLPDRPRPDSIPEPPKAKEKKEKPLNLTFRSENRSLCILVPGSKYHEALLALEAREADEPVYTEDVEEDIDPEIWKMVEEALK